MVHSVPLETVGVNLETMDMNKGRLMLQDLGTDIYTVGINLRNTEEIDGVSSKPLDEFQTLINSEGELNEVAGIYRYRMERGDDLTIWAFESVWLSCS